MVYKRRGRDTGQAKCPIRILATSATKNYNHIRFTNTLYRSLHVAKGCKNKSDVVIFLLTYYVLLCASSIVAIRQAVNIRNVRQDHVTDHVTGK